MMSPILTIAGKEIKDGLRNRWIVGATMLLAALAFALALLGSAPTGQLAVKPLAVTVVSLSSLTIFLVPLIALLLSYDAIVGESERGFLLLLLTYPVTRGQIIAGKFVGHVAIIAIATTVGYGAAAVATGLGDNADADSWKAFAWLIASSTLLGAAFIAMAYVVSVRVRERATAAGIAVALWLFFVLVFDLAALGAMIAIGDMVSSELFSALLLLNPADVYRLSNLSGFENVRAFAGMAGVDVQFPLGLLASVLLAWTAVPMGAAVLLFRRRES